MKSDNVMRKLLAIINTCLHPIIEIQIRRTKKFAGTQTTYSSYVDEKSDELLRHVWESSIVKSSTNRAENSEEYC